MKAIVNVNKGSAYSHLNGRTYEIESFGSRSCTLDISSCSTVFSYTEILIVDIDKEYYDAKRDFERGECIPENIRVKNHFSKGLEAYIKINRIQGIF